MEILKTKNYDLFHYFNFNRSINWTHVNGIAQSIKSIGYDISKPISVNKDYGIKEGQHRFEACKKLQEWVYYVISNSEFDPLNEVIQTNANQRVWSLGDYIHAWATTGIKCYQFIEKFEIENKLGYTNTLTIVSGCSSSGARNIRRGGEIGINVHINEVLAFVKFANNYLQFAKQTQFVRAITITIPRLNESQLEKLRNNIMLIRRQPSINDYLLYFENLLNKGIKNESNRVALL